MAQRRPTGRKTTAKKRTSSPTKRKMRNTRKTKPDKGLLIACGIGVLLAVGLIVYYVFFDY